MNKKLIAAAVAGALAAPTVVFAQSTVTISGQLKASVNQIRFGGATPTAAGTDPRTGNHTETRYVDETSQIRFTMREDLGGGLAATAQFEFRPTTDGSSGFGTTSGFGSTVGNSWIGLQSNSWGMVRFGAIDRHYTLSADTAAALAPTFTGAAPVGSYLAPLAATTAGQPQNAGGTAWFNPTTGSPTTTGGATTGVIGSATIHGSRMRNQIGWDSPNWGGFTMTTGWAQRPTTGQETDLVQPPAGVSPIRKTNNWWLTGRYDASNWFVGASYLRQNGEANSVAAAAASATASATSAAQMARNVRGWRIVGRYNFGGGFGLGLNYDKTRAYNVGNCLAPCTNVFVGKVADRTAWALVGDFTTGAHLFGLLYSRAGDDKVLGSNTGARQWSFRYAYSLSKRTSAGFGYARLRNEAGAAYSHSGDNATGANAYSTVGSNVWAGEDTRVIGMNVRHQF